MIENHSGCWRLADLIVSHAILLIGGWMETRREKEWEQNETERNAAGDNVKVKESCLFWRKIMVSQNQRAAGRSDDKIWEKRWLWNAGRSREKLLGIWKKIPEEAERSPDCKNAKDRCDAWGLSGILVWKYFQSENWDNHENGWSIYLI